MGFTSVVAYLGDFLIVAPSTDRMHYDMIKMGFTSVVAYLDDFLIVAPNTDRMHYGSEDFDQFT